MSGVRFSAKAAEDLLDIDDYTFAEFGPAQARRYRAQIERTCVIIGETPELGRRIDAIDPPVRFFPCGSQILVYVIEADGVLILRVRHQREDWKDELDG
mgnify:CR=1 FL=1